MDFLLRIIIEQGWCESNYISNESLSGVSFESFKKASNSLVVIICTDFNITEFYQVLTLAMCMSLYFSLSHGNCFQTL